MLSILQTMKFPYSSGRSEWPLRSIVYLVHNKEAFMGKLNNHFDRARCSATGNRFDLDTDISQQRIRYEIAFEAVTAISELRHLLTF